MDIIQSYLKTVGLYLPPKISHDITEELEDEIRSQVTEQERHVQRPLQENEVADILRNLGDPVVVASRYRKRQPSFTMGRTLIGPELFPYYVALLMFSALITCGWFIYAVVRHSVNIPMMAFSFAIQFICITVILSFIEFFRRKFPRDWFFPPSAMVASIPVAKWKSAVGLVLWSLFGLWWLLVPHYPFLLFGSIDNLKLAPGFLDFHLSVFVLLVLGWLQRVVNLIRPHWTWLPPVSRLMTNTGGLVICFLMVRAYPYVTVSNPDLNPAYYQHLAGNYNAGILYGFLLSWLWIFFIINAAANTWLLIQYAHRTRQQS